MATPRIAVKTPAYGHELAELILAHHQASDAGPGARLMTERQLASYLGVTRTMIRHALAILEAEGRISREVGRGTFISGDIRREVEALSEPRDARIDFEVNYPLLPQQWAMIAKSLAEAAAQMAGRPDVVRAAVLDARVHDSLAIERKLRSSFPATRIVVLPRTIRQEMIGPLLIDRI